MRLTFTDHASHPHQPVTRHVFHNISRADFAVLEILPDFKGIVNPGSKMASCSRRFGISYWGRLEDLAGGIGDSVGFVDGTVLVLAAFEAVE